MRALDMSPIIKKYHGLFVALSADRKTVFGQGTTPHEALNIAFQKGYKNPILTKIPEEMQSYLLRC